MSLTSLVKKPKKPKKGKRVDITYVGNGATHKWLVDAKLYLRYELGALVEERSFTPDDESWCSLVQQAASTGTGDFLNRVRTALTNDAAYLDKVQAGTATQQDHTQQVAALTRQIQALIVYSVLRND